jgi:hypothetical protein
MVTTIQISEKTKEELFLIKSRLELATGRKFTLEEAIKWLIAKEGQKDNKERRKAIDELFGIAKQFGITILDVSELRRQRDSRFEGV